MTEEERKLESKNITIGFDAAKLDALEFVLRKQRSSVQRRMEEGFIIIIRACGWAVFRAAAHGGSAAAAL